MTSSSPLPDDYVVRLFLAYFERAPEYEALVYYRATLDAMRALGAESGLDDGQVRTRFSTLLYETGAANGELPAAVIEDDGQFVSHLYGSVLGRAPDAGGHAYWLAELAGGMSRAQLVDIFLVAAQGSPRDAAYLANRVQVASEFAAWENSNPGVLASLVYDAARVLEGVNEDPASVLAAEARLLGNQPEPPGPPPVAPGPPVSQSFLLTTSADDFKAGQADDVFIAPVRHDGSGLQASLQTGDRLDGAGGRDLLEADLYGSTAAPTTAGIEALRLYNSASGRDAVLDLVDASGHLELEFLASAGAILVRNVGEIESIAIRGAQADVLAIEGVASRELAISVQGVSDTPGGWTRLWLGNEESTYAQDGPYVTWLERLDLRVTDSTDGLYLLNTAAGDFNLHTEGNVRVRLEGNASETFRISGSGTLTLSEPSIGGTFFLNAEYARVFDSTGFDGVLRNVVLVNTDDDNFANGVVALGEGRQTIGFDTAIADGVTITGGSRADSWTTLELTQSAYDSLAGFAAGSVTNVDALGLVGEANGAYAVLHGTSAFTFGWGIVTDATVTLDVGAVQPAFVELGGDMAAGGYGRLVVQSEAVLPELVVRLANWAPGSANYHAEASIEVAARELVLEAGQGLNPLGIGGGSTWYSVNLRDADPAGSLESLVLTGSQALSLQIATPALRSVDASQQTGGVEVDLGSARGVSVIASPHWDTFIIAANPDAAAPLNTISGLGADDLIVLEVGTAFAAGASFGELLTGTSADDVQTALALAYDKLDTGAGAQAGWFLHDGMTYLVAKEGDGASAQYVAVELQGTGFAFDPWISGSTAEIYVL